MLNAEKRRCHEQLGRGRRLCAESCYNIVDIATAPRFLEISIKKAIFFCEVKKTEHLECAQREDSIRACMQDSDSSDEYENESEEEDT